MTKKIPTSQSPVFHKMTPSGDLQRSKRVANAFVLTVRLRRAGSEKAVSFHMVGRSMPKVRAVDVWKVTPCISRGSDRPSEVVHFHCTPADKGATADTDSIFMATDGKVVFTRKPLKSERSAERSSHRSRMTAA